MQLFLQRAAAVQDTYLESKFKSIPQTEFTLSIQDAAFPHQCNHEIITLNLIKCWDVLDTGVYIKRDN